MNSVLVSTSAVQVARTVSWAPPEPLAPAVAVRRTQSRRLVGVAIAVWLVGCGVFTGVIAEKLSPDSPSNSSAAAARAR